jgi:hypothetical protein
MNRFSDNGKAKRGRAVASSRNGRAKTSASSNGRLSKTKTVREDTAASYNKFKEFEGRRYTGMKVGRSHKWYYDKGEWKEKKVTPDKWQFTYAVTKRRAGKAPEGSGVPVGTEYHWYILAHQNVRKLNANDYSTSMTGMKFKVAHMRAATQKWSASEQAQRKRIIQLLKDTLRELESQAAEPQRGRRVASSSATRRRRKSASA